MPAGLQVFNSFGTVQIDENWKNYGFRQIVPVSFTLEPPIPGQSAAPVDYTLTLSGAAVLVAARSELLQVVAGGSLLSGTTWTFNWRIHPPPAPAPGASYSETVIFYVFDVPVSGGFSNVGLEVFNASGERVFHSDMDVMKIRSVQPCSSGFTGLSGRIYAPLIVLNPIKSTYTGSSYVLSSRALRASGSALTSSVVNVPGTGFLEFGDEGLYAAVDVTGLS